MTEPWQDVPFAPARGTPICAAAAMEGNVASFDLGGFPLILIRSADGLRAYVNACPHQYLPLDWRSANLLSVDGTVLRCSNHDAGFNAVTGVGVDGLGLGCDLVAVPVEELDGQVFIA